MKDYRSAHLVKYEKPNSTGFTSIQHLEFLKGTEWNQGALNYVHSLRPTSIRVTEGRMKMDARLWRVTVIVDENNIIEEITQECEVGLEGFKNGCEMDSNYGL